MASQFLRVNPALPLLLLLLIASCAAAADDKAKAGDDKAKPAEKKDMGPVIGIDLGTTYSCVGIFKNGRVEILPNDQGNRITPSYVAFTQDGERLVGDAAKNQLTTNPENTVFDAKRIIGRAWGDPSIQHDAKYFPFKVVERDGKPFIGVKVGGEDKEFAPEEISAMVLGKMRDIAEGYLGRKVENAVITVPAYFNDAQRQATKNAGTISGLNVLRIINEPTAAAIAYGLDKKEGGERHILVFDLGGGTFDVSMLTIDNGVFEVIATNGDTHLGGEDFDQRVIRHFVELYKKKTGKDVSKDQRAVQKLRREVEKAKRALSSVHTARIEVESLIDGEDFSESLTRAKFEELNADLFKSTIVPVEKVLKDSNLKKEDITEVVLVGGSTRIPKVQQLVKDFFNGRAPHTGINPDEAIAYGAAVQAGVLGGDESTGEFLLLDVCPLTLGMEIEGGVMAKLINRNTPIPTKKRDIFTTVDDNQDTVMVAVYEGERALATDNHFLGRFDLTGIPPAPRGVPQVEVTFEIDANGILKVTAEDKGTGNKQQITIKNDQSRLKPEDIDKMVKDAEKFADQDKQLREKVEARSDLESYVYSMRQQLKDKTKLGGKLSAEDLKTSEEAVTKALDWLDKNKEAAKADFDSQRRQLEDTLSPIVSKIYESKEDKDRRQPPPHGPKTGSPKHDDKEEL